MSLKTTKAVPPRKANRFTSALLHYPFFTTFLFSNLHKKQAVFLCIVKLEALNLLLSFRQRSSFYFDEESYPFRARRQQRCGIFVGDVLNIEKIYLNVASIHPATKSGSLSHQFTIVTPTEKFFLLRRGISLIPYKAIAAMRSLSHSVQGDIEIRNLLSDVISCLNSV